MNKKTMEASNRLLEWLYTSNILSGNKSKLNILNVQFYKNCINIDINLIKENTIKIVKYYIYSNSIQVIKNIGKKCSFLNYRISKRKHHKRYQLLHLF